MPWFRPSRIPYRWIAAAGIAAGLLLSQGCVRWPLAHPSLAPFQGYLQKESTGDLTVHYLGTSSLLFMLAAGEYCADLADENGTLRPVKRTGSAAC